MGDAGASRGLPCPWGGDREGAAAPGVRRLPLRPGAGVVTVSVADLERLLAICTIYVPSDEWAILDGAAGRLQEAVDDAS